MGKIDLQAISRQKLRHGLMMIFFQFIQGVGAPGTFFQSFRTLVGSEQNQCPDEWGQEETAKKISPKTKLSVRADPGNDETEPDIHNGDNHGLTS
jgi:hypothetical protein